MLQMDEWLQRYKWQGFWRGGGGGDRKCRKEMNHPKRSLGRLNTGWFLFHQCFVFSLKERTNSG